MALLVITNVLLLVFSHRLSHFWLILQIKLTNIKRFALNFGASGKSVCLACCNNNYISSFINKNSEQSKLERAYKNHLSGFRTWSELAHADKWLVFAWNIGPRLSIDETCVSRGEVYTIVTNKDAHGQKGCLVAIVKGTKAKDVIEALKNISETQRITAKEITLDFSDSMHCIAEACFPKAMITLDRFHHQQFCLEAMQGVSNV